jgi:hypothetical protein
VPDSTELWAELHNTWFSVTWMTLKVEDRKNRMLNGMKEACEYAQDARALYPDITISSMMKDQGRILSKVAPGQWRSQAQIVCTICFGATPNGGEQAIDMPR